jgi:hypothetical protein
MLEVIRDALKDVVNSQNKTQDSHLIAKTITATLGLTDRQVERSLSKLKREKINRKEFKDGKIEIYLPERRISHQRNCMEGKRGNFAHCNSLSWIYGE